MDSPDVFTNLIGNTFCITVEKDNNSLELSIFDDQNKTNQIPGSPVMLAIPTLTNSLSFLQHGNISAGRPERGMTGFIDNTSLTINSKQVDTAISTMGKWGLIILTLLYLIVITLNLNSIKVKQSVFNA
jgi:hypothetical protein